MYHTRWKNTHYKAGFHYGFLLKKYHKDPLMNMHMSMSQREFAKKCLPIYQAFYPEICEEIQGISDGLHKDFDDMMSFLFSMYAFTYHNYCSCIAYVDEQHILLGRNSDFIKTIGPLSDSAYYHLESGYAFIGHTTAFCEMEDGMNEKGLAVGLTFVYPTKISVGMNAGMLVRYLLEKCASVQEAISFLKQVPIASAQTIILVDQSGDFAIVECHHEQVIVRRDKHVLWTTNHFVSPQMQAFQYLGEDDIYSHERYLTMQHFFDSHQRVNKGDLMELLSGKYGFMCQYQGEMDTIWSVVYDVKNGILKEWKEIQDVRHFLKKSEEGKYGSNYVKCTITRGFDEIKMEWSVSIVRGND